MRAMILCAGEGRRMQPLTHTTPKPLLKVDNRPLVEYHLLSLKQNGFKDIVINIAHLGYKIPEALGNGEKWGVDISYSDEQEEGGLETAGGIIKALALLSDTFLVVNGDIFTDYPFNNTKRLAEGIVAHLILVENPPHHPEGDFGINEGILTNTKGYTFSGIGYYHQEFFKDIPDGKIPLAPLIKEAIKQKKVTAELYRGEWLDIGTPQRLKELNDVLCKNEREKR